ncbi:MAG: hypothetical protein K6E30_05525, partial [Lachnospiraceae bacterium]|nr:hypothetical protein [Lachnospiraceae bacterium]
DAALAAGALTPEEALEEKNETGDNETPGTEGAAEETEAAAYAGEAGMSGDASAVPRLILVGGELYREAGIAETIAGGMYDFEFEKNVPQTEEPSEELSANFEAEGGVYLDDGRIAVYADGSWYVFISAREERS